MYKASLSTVSFMHSFPIANLELSKNFSFLYSFFLVSQHKAA